MAGGLIDRSGRVMLSGRWGSRREIGGLADAPFLAGQFVVVVPACERPGTAWVMGGSDGKRTTTGNGAALPGAGV